MYLSTDMARIGLLMLRGGEWNGKRIMPEHWAEALTELITPRATRTGRRGGAMAGCGCGTSRNCLREFP